MRFDPMSRCLWIANSRSESAKSIMSISIGPVMNGYGHDAGYHNVSCRCSSLEGAFSVERTARLAWSGYQGPYVDEFDGLHVERGSGFRRLH